MANMDYCKYRNTMLALEQVEEGLLDDMEELSSEEKRAKERIQKFIREQAECMGMIEE